MPRPSKWPFTFRFFYQNFVCISHLSHACYIIRPYKRIFLYKMNLDKDLNSLTVRPAKCRAKNLFLTKVRQHTGSSHMSHISGSVVDEDGTKVKQRLAGENDTGQVFVRHAKKKIEPDVETNYLQCRNRNSSVV
jgi:hypothetical protein